MTHATQPPLIRRRVGMALLAVVLLVSACGGDAAESSPTSDASTGETAAAPTDTTAAPDEPVESKACHDLFSDEEVSELFSEPAALEDEDTLDSIGQLVCVWGTIEDPDDASDTAAQGLTVQVYSGDPVPGSNFYDTSFYEEVRELDGIGDKAFVSGSGGVTTAFLDGDVAGFVNYFSIVFGDTDQVEATEDQVIEFLRKLHDRAT